MTPYEYTHGRFQDQESRYPAYAHAAYVAADHAAHRVLQHKYDDAHDVTPVDFHEHAVLKAVDRPESRSYEHMDGIDENYYHRYYDADQTPYEYAHGHYQDHESRYPAYAHAAYVAADHAAHRVLQHKYDDAHDVTPVDFHEHAVLKAVDRPESRSYEHTYRPEYDGYYGPEYEHAGYPYYDAGYFL